VARGVTPCGSSSLVLSTRANQFEKYSCCPNVNVGEKQNRSAAKTKPAVTHSAPRLGKCRVHEMYVTYGYTK
jgi:hypothetical protein